MLSLRKPAISWAAALAVAGVPCLVSAEQAAGSLWPATVVRFEELRLLTSFDLRVRGLVKKGRVTGPAVLRVHITADGTVARTALLETCGNSDLDEASMHAMRVMRFAPYTFGGVPTEVTLVAPVHVPPRLGRSH